MSPARIAPHTGLRQTRSLAEGRRRRILHSYLQKLVSLRVRRGPGLKRAHHLLLEPAKGRYR